MTLSYTVSVGSQTVSDPLPLDPRTNPFSVGFGVVLSAGASLTYQVEHSFDDPQATGYDPTTATWFIHSDVNGKTASYDGNYAFPVRAVRLDVTSWSSGTATLTLIQAGPI